MTFEQYAELRQKVVAAYEAAPQVERPDGKTGKDSRETSVCFDNLVMALEPLMRDYVASDTDTEIVRNTIFVRGSDEEAGRMLLRDHPALFPVWLIRNVLATDRVTFDPTMMKSGMWDRFADRYQDAILPA